MKKLYKVEHYGKNREDWLAHRGIGGSSVSAIFGKNPYMNALDIYCSAVNPSDEKKDKDTASTIYGKKAEELIARFFDNHLGDIYELRYPKSITQYRRKDKPFMTYTADAILIEKGTGRKGILEIKTHIVQSRADAENWRDGQIPENYTLQVFQGLAVLNDTDFVELCVELVFIDYDTGKWKASEIRHLHRERVDEAENISKVEEIETEFYKNHIEKQIPPNLKIKIEL